MFAYQEAVVKSWLEADENFAASLGVLGLLCNNLHFFFSEIGAKKLLNAWYLGTSPLL